MSTNRESARRTLACGVAAACLTLLASCRSVPAPDAIRALGLPSAHPHTLMVKAPPEQSWSALPNPVWSDRLRRLSIEGCGEVVDVARIWALERAMPVTLGSSESGRTGVFETAEPHGYFYIEVSWLASRLGTVAVTGYLVRFEITYYSAKHLGARELGRLQADMKVHDELVPAVEMAAKRCGWFGVKSEFGT